MPDAAIDKLPVEIVELASAIEDELQDWFAAWWNERQRAFGLIGPDTEIEELETEIVELGEQASMVVELEEE